MAKKKGGLGSHSPFIETERTIEKIIPQKTQRAHSPQSTHLTQAPQVAQKPSQRGLKEGWDRITYIVKQEHIEKIKALAYWERVEIKDVVDEAFTEYLRGKRVKPIPEKTKTERA